MGVCFFTLQAQSCAASVMPAPTCSLPALYSRATCFLLLLLRSRSRYSWSRALTTLVAHRKSGSCSFEVSLQLAHTPTHLWGLCVWHYLQACPPWLSWVQFALALAKSSSFNLLMSPTLSSITYSLSNSLLQFLMTLESLTRPWMRHLNWAFLIATFGVLAPSAAHQSAHFCSVAEDTITVTNLTPLNIWCGFMVGGIVALAILRHCTKLCLSPPTWHLTKCPPALAVHRLFDHADWPWLGQVYGLDVSGQLEDSAAPQKKSSLNKIKLNKVWVERIWPRLINTWLTHNVHFGHS